MATYIITDATIDLTETKRNKWMSNENWKANQKLREEAKTKNELYYVPNKACKNGHFKRYVNNNCCVECAATVKKNLRISNPDHAKAQKIKHHLKSIYGLSVEKYEEFIKKQSNVCAICEKPETAKFKDKIKKLAVDHCSKTGKVRGLLCLNCNMGIGKLMHNPELLRKAALYCEDSNET